MYLTMLKKNMVKILLNFMNIEVWCNWFTRSSDKAEFIGSNPITSTTVVCVGSSPTCWTTKFLDTFSNSKAHYWL